MSEHRSPANSQTSSQPTQAGEAWWELDLNVPSPLADDLGAMFFGEGATGVELKDAKDVPLPPDAQANDRAPAAPQEGRAWLRVSWPDPPGGDVVETAGRILEGFGIAVDKADLERDLHRRTDNDWATRWKEFFHPLQLGESLWVVPVWEREAFNLPSGCHQLLLEPGMAFGTGQHATTALCVRVLEEAFQQAQPSRLLDVGCGSGILSLAAALLGVPSILGVDNDPLAVTAALENVDTNNMAELVQISETPVGELTAQYPWVVANILAHILIDLAPALISRVQPSGQLLLSGLQDSQRSEVIAAFESSAGALGRTIRVSAERTQEPWLALLLWID